MPQASSERQLPDERPARGLVAPRVECPGRAFGELRGELPSTGIDEIEVRRMAVMGIDLDRVSSPFADTEFDAPIVVNPRSG